MLFIDPKKLKDNKITISPKINPLEKIRIDLLKKYIIINKKITQQLSKMQKMKKNARD